MKPSSPLKMTRLRLAALKVLMEAPNNEMFATDWGFEVMKAQTRQTNSPTEKQKSGLNYHSQSMARFAGSYAAPLKSANYIIEVQRGKYPHLRRFFKLTRVGVKFLCENK